MKQFIVMEHDKNKRRTFYNYLVKRYNLDICYPFEKNSFIDSHYPFVIDFSENKLWICNSITCLACASQCGMVVSIDVFKINMD